MNLHLNDSELKVLKTISLSDGISRKELAHRTGLSQAAITMISRELIQGSFIVEGEKVGSGLGRKEVMLYSNPHQYSFLGIDIGGYRIRMALANNSLELLHEREFLVASAANEQDKGAFVVDCIRGFLSELKEALPPLSAIGIGVTGIVDADRQTILNIPNADHWNEVPIVRCVQEAFACPVYLDEGGRTLALAEKYLGMAKDIEDFILVHSAYGVVAGIVTNGRLLRGAHNLGGLLGHITADPNGTRCLCGNYGCLENIVTYPMLEQDFLDRSSSSTRQRTLLEAYRENDKHAIDVCIHAGHALGIALSNVVNLFNPLAIYLGGPMFDDFPILFEETKRTIILRANRFATVSLRLERSTFNHQQGIFGALLLAKHRFLFPKEEM